MAIKKKSFLILTAIPMYLSYCFLNYVFFKKPVIISDVLCFATFVISVVFIIAFSKKSIRVIAFALPYITLVLTSIFTSRFTDLTMEKVLIYSLFALPPIVIIAFYNVPVKNKNGLNKKQKRVKNESSILLAVFNILISVLLITVFALTLSGRERVSVALDSTAICMLLFLVLMVGLSVSSLASRQNIKMHSALLCIAGAVDCLCYIIWANQYVNDKVYLVFPLFMAFVYLFSSQSTAL